MGVRRLTALALALLALVAAQDASAWFDVSAGQAVVPRPFGTWPRSDPGHVQQWSTLRSVEIRWRNSISFGTPGAGWLRRGVRFPAEGEHFFTWDPVLHVSPNSSWRRWGTDDLARTVLRVVTRYARAHPAAPRVGVGDLSRRHGGPFGPKHATHQNGLDADVYYPRLDRRERPPKRARQIDRALAQALVDLFVSAGADLIYVGPNTRLTGPPGVVRVLWNHDNHLHVRIRDSN
jgi:murein endopeptidase